MIDMLQVLIEELYPNSIVIQSKGGIYADGLAFDDAKFLRIAWQEEVKDSDLFFNATSEKGTWFFIPTKMVVV